MRHASSTSPHTGMPDVGRGQHQGVVRWHAGRGDDELRARGGLAHVLGPEPHVDVEDLEDRGALGDRVGDVARHGRHAGATLGEGVGGGEAGHAEADDEHLDAGPVGVAVGQPLPGLVARVERHCEPTTHSA